MHSEDDYNRWIEGRMDEAERIAFERTLADSEKDDAEVWSRLKPRLAVPDATLPNADFLNHRVAEAIAAPPAPRLPEWLRPSRLAWAGATCLILATLTSAWLLPGVFQPLPESEFLSKVLETEARADVSAYAFRAPNSRGVVIWTVGTEFIPLEEKVQ
ncbi:MAG: hypothetical protein SFU53_02045 [Terrimicrobiaceae bacterium]|nr:hypothetical protein [Terrimicrobiaceae bacterium]